MEDQRDLLDQLTQYIPEIQGYREAQYIAKGYSSDRKYRVRCSNDLQVLLKVFSLQDYASKEQEYHMLRQLEVHEVRSSRQSQSAKF